jgi:hypothetical protein
VQMTRAYARSPKGRRLNIIFQQWFIEQLLLNAEEYRDGIILELNGEVKWLIPVYAVGITDWPEGQEWTGIKQGAAKSKSNCRLCNHPTKFFGVTKFGPLGGMRSTARFHVAHR